MTRPSNPDAVAVDPALSMPLSPARPAEHSLEIVSPDEVRFTRGPRSYRVRGLARCLSAESLRVTVRVSRRKGVREHFHLKRQFHIAVVGSSP